MRFRTTKNDMLTMRYDAVFTEDAYILSDWGGHTSTYIVA
jgi:hypothetical protein